jgi:uncharacterized protein YkwD
MARTRTRVVVAALLVVLTATAGAFAMAPGENEQASSLPLPLGSTPSFRRVNPAPFAVPTTTTPAPVAPTVGARFTGASPTGQHAPTGAPQPPPTAATAQPPPPAPVASSVLSGAAGQLVGLINGVRAGLGLAPYAVDPELAANAERWARSMAAAAKMSHQGDLSVGLSAPWVRLGENVGVGLDVQVVHNALVASPGHYANLADPAFGFVGVGVVESGGTLYVAEEFMQL